MPNQFDLLQILPILYIKVKNKPRNRVTQSEAVIKASQYPDKFIVDNYPSSASIDGFYFASKCNSVRRNNI
jgi:hypothetical protein